MPGDLYHGADPGRGICPEKRHRVLARGLRRSRSRGGQAPHGSCCKLHGRPSPEGTEDPVHKPIRGGLSRREWRGAPLAGGGGRWRRRRAWGEAKAPQIGRRRVATGANHPASQSSALRRGPGTPAVVLRRGTRAPVCMLQEDPPLCVKTPRQAHLCPDRSWISADGPLPVRIMRSVVVWITGVRAGQVIIARSRKRAAGG